MSASSKRRAWENEAVTGKRRGRFTRSVARAPTHLYDWGLGWILRRRFLRLMSSATGGCPR